RDAQIASGRKPAVLVHMVGVVAAGCEPHAPRARDGESAGIALAKAIGALAEVAHVRVHSRFERAEERVHRRARKVRRLERQLAATANRLLQGMMTHDMKAFDLARAL